MPRADRLAALLLAVAVPASAATFHRTLILDDQVGAAEAHFGSSIAASPAGGVVIGAPGGDEGSAQIFDATTGALRQIIPQPDETTSFGARVAATASDVLVSDPSAFADDAQSGTVFGAVYRFAPDGTDLDTFFSPAPDASFAFGSQLAASGGAALVRDTHAIDRIDVATGTLLGTLPAPAAASADFGLALAATASVVYVGDPGAERVFVFDAASGNVVQTITAPTAAVAARFGSSLALLENGDLLVGAPLGTGAVYRIEPATGSLQAAYENPLAVQNVGFGNTVAVLGDAVIVGAPSFSLSESGIQDGAAFAFDAASGALVAVLGRQSPDFLDAFGAALAPAAGQVFVGVPHEDADQVEAFALDCQGAASCAAADAGIGLRSVRVTADSATVRATFRATAAEMTALRAGARVCLIGDDGPVACTAWDPEVDDCSGSDVSFSCTTDEGRVSARHSHHGHVRLSFTASTITTAPPAHVLLRLTLGATDGDGDDPTRAGAARRCRVRRGIGHCR